MKYILFGFFALSSLLFSQKILTLDESISTALGESYSNQSANLNLTSSQKNLEATQLGLRTSVDLEFDLPRYNRSLSSIFDPESSSEKFYDIGSTILESRITFNQPIIFTNGTFSVVGSVFGRDQFSGSNPVTRDYYGNVQLRLRQPLFTFNSLSANLERAEINLEKAKRNYTRAQADIIYNVTDGFYNLYQLKRSMEITQERVNQTDTAYNSALNKFKAGLISEVEALQLEVDLISSKNELLNTKRRYEDAKNNFKLLIGLPIKEDIDIKGEIDFVNVPVILEEAVSLAITNRPELLNSEADIKLSELTFDEVDYRGRISADLSVNYGINKNDSEFKYIFKDFAENRNIVFTVSIPVWNWGKTKKETESAMANLTLTKLNHENQKQSIEREIISAVNRINSAKARVEVLSKSVEVAQKTYNISLSRFESGNITSFDLSQMQIKLTDAKLNNLNALIDYKLALADLQRKTLHSYGK